MLPEGEVFIEVGILGGVKLSEGVHEAGKSSQAGAMWDARYLDPDFSDNYTQVVIGV